MPKRFLKRHPVIGLIGALALAIWAYGYWQVSTRGYLYISIWDHSERDRAQPIKSGNLRLLDASGNELARFDTEPLYGVFYLTEPKQYSCHDMEAKAPFSATAREQWQACHEQYSRWLVTWLKSVQFANLAIGNCQFREIPVSADRSEDYSWLLWWVPLPHVGGSPNSIYRVRIRVNVKDCSILNM